MPHDDVEFTKGQPITLYVNDEKVRTYKHMGWAKRRAAREILANPNADVLIDEGTTRVSTTVTIGFPQGSSATRDINVGEGFRFLHGTGVVSSAAASRDINLGASFRFRHGTGVSKAPSPSQRAISTGAPFRFAEGQGVSPSPAPPGTGVATHGKSMVCMRLPFAGDGEIASFAFANQLGRREGAGSPGAAIRTVRTAFTVSDMVVRVLTNTSDAATVYRVMRNSVATSLSISVPAGSTGEFKNTTASEAFVVGDTIHIECDRSLATGVGQTGAMVGPIFECTIDAGSSTTITPIMAVGGPYNASATSEFVSLAQFRDWDWGTEAQSQTRVDMDCTAQNAWLYVETNNRTTATTFTLNNGGTATSISITVPAGQTGYFEPVGSPTETVSEGDLLGWEALGGAETTLLETSQVGVELSATNPGESIMVLEHNNPIWTLTSFPTAYWPLCGNMRTTDEITVEANAKQEARFECAIDKLSCYVDSNTLTDTSTITLRKHFNSGGSSISASPTLSIGSGVTGWITDSTGETSSYQQLDEFNYELVGGATGTALTPLRFGARVTYTPPTGGTPGGFDDVAELPRSEPPIDPPDTTSYNVITVNTGGGADYTSLQSALDDPLILTQNNVIEIQSGNSFTLRHQPRRGKTGNFWTVIRPTGHASLVGRVDPTETASMYTLNCPLQGTSWSPCIDFESGADRYWFIGAEITVPNDSTDRTRSSLVDCRPQNGGSLQVLADYPTNIGFDRCYAHASTTDTPGRRNVTRIYTMEAIDFSIVNGYSQVVRYGGQGGFLWTTTAGFGPARVENNYHDGNCFIAGGIPNPPIPGKMPTDFTIRKNHFHKSAIMLDGTGGIGVLNQFEFKIGERYLIEQNIFEGNEADQQSGKGILMRNTNQSGGSGTANLSQDITFRWNLVEDTPACLDLSARGSANPGPVEPMKRLSIHDNLFVHIGANTDSGGAGQQHQLVMNDQVDSWHIFHNTWDNPGSVKDGLCSHANPITGSDFQFKDNICWRGAFGWRAFTPNSNEGTASINAADASADFDFNVVVDASPASYPAADNDYPAPASSFAVNNWRNSANGDYRLIVGSTYSSTGTAPASDGEDRGCDVNQLCGSSYVNPTAGSKLAGVRQAGV